MIGGVKKRQEVRGLGPVYKEVGDPGNPLRWGNPPVRNIMTLILV